ncbi:MAG TPA: LuxR C-terminal-related transcriptional regulator [Acidimicrobiales bacterium]|nr:LuxR C-terminal-related transcriptional regulator [Acidimicrobiales bacterium]
MGAPVNPLSPEALANCLPITNREADVLALVAIGMSNAEVARALSIRVGTVVKHLEHIYRKLSVPTRAAATALAVAAVTSRESAASLKHPTRTRLAVEGQEIPYKVTADEMAATLPITHREAEVLALVAVGLTNSQVARELSIRVGTVVKHLERLYPKLGVASRTGAVARALSVHTDRIGKD